MTLKNGDRIIINGKPIVVDDAIVNKFVDGDALFGLSGGQILHVGRGEISLVDASVSAAKSAFFELGSCSAEQISMFYSQFAEKLLDPIIRESLLTANKVDVQSAIERGRQTTRLLLDNSILDGMADALKVWQKTSQTTGQVLERIEHAGWAVQSEVAPLGVVAFVFEGRPNVFADATGVLRSGNTCVFRIGSDALNTARSMMDLAVRPALKESGLPVNAVVLLDAASHSSAWALFANKNIGLAVARGSGHAVAQLGEIAQLSGTAVSLHGTGGAWMLVGVKADEVRLAQVVERSLDRKVCNTLNVIGVPLGKADELISIIAQSVALAGRKRNCVSVVHACSVSLPILKRCGVELVIKPLQDGELSTEWEWDAVPECSIFVFDDLEHGVETFNEHAPNFIVSLISEDKDELEFVWSNADAPFVGNGFTRWVDGQFALNKPELGLSNWQNGRVLGRGSILSGDSVFSVRYRSEQNDINLSR
jgi:glutamate-5-semialdehyde dehydrogenase